jgi:hypothetical protein
VDGFGTDLLAAGNLLLVPGEVVVSGRVPSAKFTYHMMPKLEKM